MKLCECGCGEHTKIGKNTHELNRFMWGHNPWKGGRFLTTDGRLRILAREHPRADHQGYVLRSLLIAEKALGKPIPLGRPVHHVDEDKSNDSSNNFVICESTNYHHFLHQRKRAYDACGNASWRKCSICKKYDSVDKLYVYQKYSYHRECKNKYNRKRQATKQGGKR